MRRDQDLGLGRFDVELIEQALLLHLYSTRIRTLLLALLEGQPNTLELLLHLTDSPQVLLGKLEVNLQRRSRNTKYSWHLYCPAEPAAHITCCLIFGGSWSRTSFFSRRFMKVIVQRA